MVVEDRFEVPSAGVSSTDDLPGPALHRRWIAPWVDPSTYARPGTDSRRSGCSPSASPTPIGLERVGDTVSTRMVVGPLDRGEGVVSRFSYSGSPVE